MSIFSLVLSPNCNILKQFNFKIKNLNGIENTNNLPGATGLCKIKICLKSRKIDENTLMI